MNPLPGRSLTRFGSRPASRLNCAPTRNATKPVTAVYPDQDGPGTLVIPNTASLIKGGPNPENGRRLLEFLLSDEAEEILARHQRAHIPLKPGIARPAPVKVPGEFQTMKVDFQRVGERIEERLAGFVNPRPPWLRA